MVWSSTTRVARLSDNIREELWRSTPSAQRRTERDTTRVCCYALQGNCRYGSTCEFSHDVALGRQIGCQYRKYCHYGHEALAKAFGCESDTENTGDGLDKGFFNSCRLLRADEVAYTECRGLAFDSTDPIWEEVCAALVKPSEDIGDADMTSATRSRLIAEGVYRLVDEDTSDEWLCLPGVSFQQRLEAVQERMAKVYRDWVVDDLIDARVVWEQVSPAIARRWQRSKEIPANLREEGEDALHKASEQIREKLDRVIGLGPKLLPVSADGEVKESELPLRDELSSSFRDAVIAALDAVRDIQQVCVEFTRRRQRRFAKPRYAWQSGGTYNGAKARSQSKSTASEHREDSEKQDDGQKDASAGVAETDTSSTRSSTYATRSYGSYSETASRMGNPLDDELRADASDVSDLNSFRVTQLRRCLERCLFVCHSVPQRGAGGAQPPPCEKDSALSVAFSVGDDAEVVGLTDIAEKRLNGQVGKIEDFLPELAMWQLRLHSSGTRLLLPPGQLTKSVSKQACRERSRSPRLRSSPQPDKIMSAPSLLDVVRRAAAKGEHVLVHHIVAWSA